MAEVLGINGREYNSYLILDLKLYGNTLTCTEKWSLFR